MDKDGSRPLKACSKQILGDIWFSVITDVFGRMVLDGCGWFWELADRFGWFQVVFNDLQFQ